MEKATLCRQPNHWTVRFLHTSIPIKIQNMHPDKFLKVSASSYMYILVHIQN